MTMTVCAQAKKEQQIGRWSGPEDTRFMKPAANGGERTRIKDESRVVPEIPMQNKHRGGQRRKGNGS